MLLFNTRCISTTATTIQYQLIRCRVLRKNLISVKNRHTVPFPIRLFIFHLLLNRVHATVPLSEEGWRLSSIWRTMLPDRLHERPLCLLPNRFAYLDVLQPNWLLFLLSQYWRMLPLMYRSTILLRLHIHLGHPLILLTSLPHHWLPIMYPYQTTIIQTIAKFLQYLQLN